VIAITYNNEGCSRSAANLSTDPQGVPHPPIEPLLMLEVTPLKEARISDELTRLPVLVQIQPPESGSKSRPSLNVGLVLDRSGSMSGIMELTIQAACEAVKRLGPEDKVTIVTFDHQVDVLHSGAVKQEWLEEILRSITVGGQTALHGGWDRGAKAMRQFSNPNNLSRLILLTDGQANEGLTEPSAICREVAGGARHGIQTTTLGFGYYYNQDLLRGMAQAGGGNHCYIENADMLGEFFSEEMQSLSDTQGTFVKLSVAPAPEVVARGLEARPRDLDGRLWLANLVSGQPLSVLFHLEIPPEFEGDLLQLKLDWHDLDSGSPNDTTFSFNLPSVDRQTWDSLEPSPLVQEHLALEQANDLREKAMQFVKFEAHEVALQWLDWAMDLAHLPEEEKAVLEDLSETVERGDYSAGFKKSAMYSHGHGHGHGRTSGHYAARANPSEKSKKRNKLPLGKGSILGQPLEGAYPKWSRVEGMLRGHFFGERLVRGNRSELGEGSALSAVTLRQQSRYGFSPRQMALDLHEAPVLNATSSLRKFRHRYDEGSGVLLELGAQSAGCAALRRMCPLLANFHSDVRDELFTQAILATVLTHRDNLAMTASIGYLALLWELLRQPMAPDPEFYSRVFLESIEGLQWGDGYRAPQQNKAMQGWRGHPQEYIPRVLGEARKQEWSAETAMRLWGSGPYLLEILPTVLYILELHGHEPDRAMRVASTNTYEPDTPAILVGAALGALHGKQPGWFLHDELEELLDETRDAWRRAGLD
jgi:Ca-activated chloride channel family protein